MSTRKVAITLDQDLLGEVDRLVAERVFPNRSRAIQNAIQEKLERLSHSRLARECSKINPNLEQRLADEGLGKDLSEWPEY